MFVSGSVETSIGASLLRSGSSHRLRSAGGLKLTCAVPLPRDSWVLKHLGLGWNQPARGFYREVCACLINQLTFRPDIKQDYPPNLSILISGGKENNCDSLSNGEWNGNSPSPNCWSSRPCGMWRLEGSLPRLSTLRMNKPEIQNTSLQYEHWSQLRFNSIFLYCFFIIISALKTPIIWSFIFFLLFYSFLRYFDFSYVFIFYSTTDLNRIRIKRY